MTTRYTLLKERALINFELLLIKWGITYQKSGEEYDFLSPNRIDNNFGACKFNAAKGVGNDFAGVSLPRKLIESIGIGFGPEDFAGYSKYGESRTSFDVIGLCQRVFNIHTYKEAAEHLDRELQGIETSPRSTIELLNRSIKRDLEIEARRGKSLYLAARAWKYCKDVNGTLGENYLKARGILGPYIEPSMKFHSRIYSKELNNYCPSLVFKISKTPDSDLLGIHRIYLSDDGSKKANVTEAKKAIGYVQGNGIWLGEPDDNLVVCEGPEEALSVRYGYKKKFVVSTIYGTNYHQLIIPDYVKIVALLHDKDPAGHRAAGKALRAYSNQGKDTRIIPV